MEDKKGTGKSLDFNIANSNKNPTAYRAGCRVCFEEKLLLEFADSDI